MQRIEEYNNTTGTLLRRYVYGVSLDECLYAIDATTSTVTYLHGDEAGSTILTTDSTGMPMQRNVYTPYGQLASGSLTSLNIGFTGQFYEPETGLYFYKARHYLPKLGRFLQPDPIGYQGGMNLYEYCGGDPINFSDPMGLFKLQFFDGIGGGLFGNTGRFIGGLIDSYVSDRVNKVIDDYMNKAINALFGGGNSGPSYAQRVQDLFNAFASSMNNASMMFTPAALAAPPQDTTPTYLKGSVSIDDLPTPHNFDPYANASKLGINLAAERAYAHKLGPILTLWKFRPNGHFDFKHNYGDDPAKYRLAQDLANWFYGSYMRSIRAPYAVTKVGAGGLQVGSAVISHMVKLVDSSKNATNIGPPSGGLDGMRDSGLVDFGFRDSQ